MPESAVDVSKFARSTGLLIDRCVQRETPFGVVWFIDEERVVTCAHNVLLYLDFLPALMVKFPGTNQEWEVVGAQLHPRFDQQASAELASRSLLEPVPALSLQDHNVAILRLSKGVSDINADARTTFNRKVAAAPPPRLKGLGGPVDELGLALVVQTITNARKDGCLVISDERNRPRVKLFCRDGRVLYAKYRSLSNESAIYQMFGHHVSGQFYFQSQAKPDWTVSTPMERNVDSLLLEAHRRMDEIPNLLLELGGEGAAYIRAVEAPDFTRLSPEVQADADRLWPYLDGGVSIDQLWDFVGMDDYAIFKALDELYRTRQIVELPFMDDEVLSPAQPLQLAPHVLLSPWDEVTALSAHPATGRAQLRPGHLVGLLRPNDPWHLLHSIPLPSRLAGCPIFKEGQLIGMHCGLLPLDPKLHALPNLLSQLLWVESIHQMISGSAKAAVIPRPSKKSVGLKMPDMTPSDDGKNLPEKVQCAKCSSWMVKQARFCGTCGQKMTLS